MEITELDKLKSKLIIDELSSKAAKWGKRAVMVPLPVPQTGEGIVALQCFKMAEKLADLFDLTDEQYDALISIPQSKGLFLGFKQYALGSLYIIPDLGLLTKSAAEDLVKSIAKTIGWMMYLAIEENKLTRSILKPEELKRLYQKAKEIS